MTREHNDDSDQPSALWSEMVSGALGETWPEIISTSEVARLLDIKAPTHGDAIQIGRAMKDLGYMRFRHRKGGKLTWSYRLLDHGPAPAQSDTVPTSAPVPIADMRAKVRKWLKSPVNRS